MMSVKQKESKLFYNFSLSNHVPKDHFLRKIEETIDFSFIYKLAKPYYSHTGQPSVDPVVLLKMMLIGYLYDITSERKLAQELRVNLAFMYFLGYDIDEETPNHSVLSKARRRFGSKIFEQFFERIVEECKSKDLIHAEKAFIDSTLIPANASLSSVVDCDQKVILKRTPKEYLKVVEESNPSDDQESKPKKNDSVVIPPKLPKNKASYSKTDPEASLIKRKNKPLKLAYKQHISVDSGKARIITACSTTPAAVSDEHKLPHLISKAYEKHDILPREVGADTKYGTADNYRFLLESQIKPSIPHAGGKNNLGFSSKNDFIYNKEKDQYMCPQNKILKKAGFVKNSRHIIYRANPKDCKRCSLLKTCTESPAGRSVIRHINETYLEKAKEHLKSCLTQTTIKQRSVYVEPVFACEKKDLGLERAKSRGLVNVSIQSLLTSTAYNLKKLVKYAEGHRQKLKTAIKSPLISNSKKATVRIEQKIWTSESITVVSNIKEQVFLFFHRILLLNFV